SLPPPPPTPRPPHGGGGGSKPAPAAELPLEDEAVEVELVHLPAGRDEERPAGGLSRRDVVMLATGGAGVLAAVGAGFGLARLIREVRGRSEKTH
ncbi:MAG: hypothetical protein K2X82_28680, partial [Gemmataceae bacterium]|nr:hypothetical protein [Gemmataceae bacterium]